MRRTITLAALAVLALAGLTACSSVNTDSGQAALHYNGGEYSSKKFDACVPPSTRRNNQGWSELFFYYPQGRRDFTFSADSGADSGPLTASTKDQQELTVRGTISFTLNTSCATFTDAAGKEWKGGKFQKFHETIGSKNWGGHRAYSTDEDAEHGAGWDDLIGVYIKNVADRAIDNEALKYTWAELYNNSAKKAQWEKDVVGAIPDLVKRQAGEDFFTINSIVLQKPDISEVLKVQLAEKQAAILRGDAAEQDKLTAKNWPGGINAYNEYQRQRSVNKAIEGGQVKVIPIPQGSSIIVQGQ